jgi:thiamine biosynthesis lipoprotein
MSERTAAALKARGPFPPWRPEFRPGSNEVRVGPNAIDLGGIGKGLAVRAAARRLATTATGLLIEAGGDCWCGGEAPEGGPWRLAVEDPTGIEMPLAVLAVSDLGVATSSVRVCSWSVAGLPVHHLIDPTTGLPGGAGLSAVTVVSDDTATSEVWSKTLFLEGEGRIASAAGNDGVAALWVRTDGTLGTTASIEPFVIWRR